MSNKPDGGPAFPSCLIETNGGILSSCDTDEGGLTSRDYFAAKALQGIIGGSTGWITCEYKPVDGLTIIENDARLAYQYADAMLKARRGDV